MIEINKEPMMFLKRLREEWLKKIIKGVPTYTYYTYEDIKLIDAILAAFEKPAKLKRDMKYKKLVAGSGCEWQIVKEEDDYLLAIVLHRGEEEADRLADAILSMLDEREKGGVSEAELQDDDLIPLTSGELESLKNPSKLGNRGEAGIAGKEE